MATAVQNGTVEASGLSLAYRERGEGETVLLLHGTALGAELWEEVVGRLGDSLHSIALSRRGYGESELPDPYRATTVAEQAEDAAAVLEALGGGAATVCGHDLGALVALDLIRRHSALVAGAVLVEPPLLALSPVGPAAVAELREAIERGAREADESSTGAVDAYLEQTAGEQWAELVGGDRLESAHRSAQAFAADLGAAPTFAFGRRDLRSIDAPIAVVTGSRSAPIRRAVSASLAELLGAASLREVDSGHLVPLEAPEAVAEAIRAVAAR